MRQPIYKGDFLSALGYALGNSIGAYIGIKYNLSAWWNFVSIMFFCFGLGFIFDWAIPKIEHKKGSITYLDLFIAGIVFVACEFVAYNYLKYDMMGDFYENIIWVVGYGVIAFVVKKIFLYWKIYRAREKFGDGSKGFDAYSENIECCQKTDYKLNKEIRANYNKDLAVRCINGFFVGKKHKGVIAYKGIPYAQPPIGELRWQKPAEPEPSDKVFEAYNFSPVLPQPNAFTSELADNPQSEDCLTLNIWKAENIQKKVPVVVYFHGGDYSYGGSANPLYNGEEFVKEYPDLIFVSFNYRFGIFGMMDFSQIPGGEEFPHAKDLIFYDQIAALRWIHNNIAAFGGDKDNVTIMGDSSGGTCALYLPLIPEAKQFFKRVISISSFPPVFSDTSIAQQFTSDLQKYLHIKDMHGFKSLTEQQLVELEAKFFKKLNLPILDNSLIPRDFYAAYAKGAANGIELILGSNTEEFNSYTAYIGKDMSDKLTDAITKFITNYISDDSKQYYLQFMQLANNDYKQFINYLAVHGPLLTIAKAHSSCGNSVRYFHWGMRSPIKEFGAFSAIEIPYILNTKKKAEKFAIIGDDYTGKLLQKMLVQFIKGENPSLKGGMVQHNEPISWPDFSKQESSVLCFEEGAKLDEGMIMKKIELINKLKDSNPHLQKDYFEYINNKYVELFNEDRQQ